MSSVEDLRREQSLAGLAHISVVSFVAARSAPVGGFWIALAGGVALARAAQRFGARHGYGASVAATLQSVAILGPIRFGVPLTQALTAPLLGRLEARGVRILPQVLICAVTRVACNAATTAFFIWVIAGGLDAYGGTYDAVTSRVPLLPRGTAGVLVVTAAGLLAWGAFASTVQVLVYRRGLRRWPEAIGEGPLERAQRAPSGSYRFDPRAVAVAAALAFGLLISSTAWPLLGGVAAWLALAWLVARPVPEVLRSGLVLTLVIAGGVLAFGLLGGLGVELVLRRTVRAALLVLVATWLGGAAGADGLRETSRRTLDRLRRVPSLQEAARVLDDLGARDQLVAAGRSMLDAVGTSRKRPLPLFDAVLAWIATESGRFQRGTAGPAAALAMARRDVALIALAAAPALVFGAG
jgi:hypothetical protein